MSGAILGVGYLSIGTLDVWCDFGGEISQMLGGLIWRRKSQYEEALCLV